MADLEGDERSERLWAARLRWRMRGAWQWPVLWTLTLVEAIVLKVLPFSGEDGTEVFGGFLIAGFLNLGIVALVGPALGLLLRRRRADLPRNIAADYASTAAMGVLFAAFLIGGIANRGTVTQGDRSGEAELVAARHWFTDNAPPEYVGGIGHENVLKVAVGLYRTCIPGAHPREKNLCVYVDTNHGIPTVREDPDQRPNAVVAGPDNPGRQ